MTLEKQEEHELKKKLNFPLISDEYFCEINSASGVTRQLPVVVFSKEMSSEQYFELRKKIHSKLNNEKEKSLNLKNVKITIDEKNKIYINKFFIGIMMNVRTFESHFGMDFIEANRLNRICKEYFVNSLKELFNDLT